MFIQRKGLYTQVLSFGELLLRLCPDNNGEWLTINQLPVFAGGAELNVAATLASWDVPSKYFTALPENPLSSQIISQLDNLHIDTSSVKFHGDRIGLYYLTAGKDLQHNSLIYDRANSAFACIKPGMINWDEVFHNVTWLNFSAICPGISEQTANVCLEAVVAAEVRGICISIDLNYRSRLWQYGKRPIDIMPLLMPYCNLVMGNIWSVGTMLGIVTTDGLDERSEKSDYLEAGCVSSTKIIEQYPKCTAVANTYRFSTDQRLHYYTSIFTENSYYISKTYQTDNVLNQVGSGDCFMAGLIFGYYHANEPQKIIDFATAAAFLKLFEKGDFTKNNINSITGFMNQNE